MAATRAEVGAAPTGERLARAAEQLLRFAGDGRVAVALLVAVGLANAVAAFLPGGARILEGLPYAILLGAVALSGVAAVALRAPAAWREWQRPGPVQRGCGRAGGGRCRRRSQRCSWPRWRAPGYRARLESGHGGRWAVHGVRRGWSRFAGLLSHLALVAIVLGVAIGAAFGSETVFTLLPGDQALLDTPEPGFSAAVRLDAFDAEFGADARPRRIDTHVTFLREGAPVREAVLRVNEPGDFDGYLVHPWTYGPAARIRITTLDGSALLDAPVPLEGVRDGLPVGSTELPSVGMVVGLALTDPATSELGVSVLDGSGLVDAARLRPGERPGIGDLEVSFDRFDAWVTLLSRSDPGMALLFGGAALLATTLAIAFWLPRRRVSIRPLPTGGARIVLRGERFDRPTDEIARLTERLGGARMTTVLDVWRAVDPEAHLVSGSLERLARPVRGIARTRAAAPHLPPSADGQLLLADAAVIADHRDRRAARRTARGRARAGRGLALRRSAPGARVRRRPDAGAGRRGNGLRACRVGRCVPRRRARVARRPRRRPAAGRRGGGARGSATCRPGRRRCRSSAPRRGGHRRQGARLAQSAAGGAGARDAIRGRPWPPSRRSVPHPAARRGARAMDSGSWSARLDRRRRHGSSTTFRSRRSTRSRSTRWP